KTKKRQAFSMIKGGRCMSEETTEKRPLLSDEDLAPLRDLRLKLLNIHKTLLDMERANFEKVFGRVTSGELLQLVINHAQFAWLRTIPALVVQIDEFLDRDEPATQSNLQGLLNQARSLFSSSGNEEFQTKYQAALQREPSAVVTHSQIMNLLREKP